MSLARANMHLLDFFALKPRERWAPYLKTQGFSAADVTALLRERGYE